MKSCMFYAGMLLLVISSCTSKLYNTPATRAESIKSIVPPTGMVYIPSGTFFYNYASNADSDKRKVSVSAFFIDKTEVTNKQYQAFINWVVDSVAITDYLKSDNFYLPYKGETIGDKKEVRKIDWKKVSKISPLWKNAPADLKEKLGPMMSLINGQRVPNPALIKYRFYYYRVDGDRNNEYITDTVGVYPNEKAWSNDFPNSQMNVMDANYFGNKLYQYNPVVGVSWKQARAYADWRSTQMNVIVRNNPTLRNFKLNFSLPTEAQWQYAAEAKLSPEDTIDRTVKTIINPKTGKQQLSLNYKQGEGAYSADGSTFTLPVTSYTPNAFGIYNMAGNVSEWTLDTYNPSAAQIVNDLNPALLYDAKEGDSPQLMRKVIRGGSWKDNGEMLNSDTRTFEDQRASHSYVGFRCVMAGFELPGEQVKTRKYRKVK